MQARMRRPIIGEIKLPRRPLRKVTGELNPDWSPRGLNTALLVATVPEFLKLIPLRQELGQAMIDEEERIIDEYCGLKEPSEGVKWPPQYPHPYIANLSEEDGKEKVYLRVEDRWIETESGVTLG